jgi:hypothetical protein
VQEGIGEQECRAAEFKAFLLKLDKQVPAGLDIHLICDNYATNKTPAIKKWLLAHPRFHLHFTPTFLAQPGRTLVRRTDQQADTTWRPQISPGPGEGHP